MGPWNETPVLMTPTELLGQGGITVHALQANGDGALVFAPDDPAADADQALDDLNIYPDVRIPDPDDGEEQRGSGCQVQPKQYVSFRRARAHAGPAGLTGFTGGGELTTQYLTKRQGRRYCEGFTHGGYRHHPGRGNRDRRDDLVGTDHVLRLSGTRVEAFSGLAETSSATCGTGGWSSTGERRTPCACHGVPRGRGLPGRTGVPA
ncbi:hypothetical protein [Streptomyces mutabilis]|uniref:hypothetical protein n=1 Tax=Streptomyces mutabilis TaxID=67332 RepID=UPI0034DE47BE